MSDSHKDVRTNTLQILERLKADLAELAKVPEGNSLTAPLRKTLDSSISELITQLVDFRKQIDPIRQPSSVFDPANPAVVARFVSLAMIAQERVPLLDVDRFYGAGVYAIYYQGDFAPYRPIAGTESPIYVGKANPADAHAKTPLEQGEKLSGRLREHLKSIRAASDTLNASDFKCRYLVVQSGWQDAAETFLINLFRPVWNNEVNVCYGIGKHGDSASTRANLRSPWDTLHPGRAWAGDSSLDDARPREQIVSDIERHLSSYDIYSNWQDIIRAFLTELQQL